MDIFHSLEKKALIQSKWKICNLCPYAYSFTTEAEVFLDWESFSTFLNYSFYYIFK